MIVQIMLCSEKVAKKYRIEPGFYFRTNENEKFFFGPYITRLATLRAIAKRHGKPAIIPGTEKMK